MACRFTVFLSYLVPRKSSHTMTIPDNKHTSELETFVYTEHNIRDIEHDIDPDNNLLNDIKKQLQLLHRLALQFNFPIKAQHSNHPLQQQKSIHQLPQH